MEMIIFFQLSLRFAAKDSASNTPALAPVRVCCQAGDKPLSAPMMTQCIDVPWNIWYKSHQIQSLNVSRLALQLSLPNPLKPG